MVSELRVVRLGDFIDASLGKMLDAKKNKGTPQPYLGNSNVRWGQFDLSDLSQMRFEEHEESRYGLRDGDLVVCEGGEPGRCAIWRGQVPGMKIQKALHRVRGKNGLSNEYLYYWLTFAERVGLLEPHFTGTTIKHLTGRALASIEMPLPPVADQSALVDVLKPLDDSIENLRQTNTTLESIAQALFKSWFVDFDPVRAKAEGREPEGMDAATAALFPSEFEESELGPIPRGWQVEGLGKCCENIRKQARPGALDATTRYIGLEHMPRKSIALSEWGSADGLASGKFWYQRGDVLFGKLRPYFHKVGVASHVGVCSTDILVVRAKSPAWFGFVAMHLSSNVLISYATQLSNGAKMPRTNWHDLAAYKVALPDEACALAFGVVASPLLERIHLGIDEMRSLAELRDTLLTRLISGKLRLPEAEEAIEEALA